MPIGNRFFAPSSIFALPLLLLPIAGACSSNSDTPAADDAGNSCSCDVTVNGDHEVIACGDSNCVGGDTYSCDSTAQISNVPGCAVVSNDAGTNKDTGVITLDGGPKDSGGTDTGGKDACVSPAQATAVFSSTVQVAGRASSLNVVGSDLYYLWQGIPTGGVSIKKVPTAGGTPTDVLTLDNKDASDMGLTIAGSTIFYTDKFDSTVSQKVDALFKMPLTGTSGTMLTNAALSSGGSPAIGRAIAVDATRAYVPFDKGGATNAAGIRVVPINGTATSTLPGTSAAAFATQVVAADPSGYVAVYQEPTDKKIRVYDPANSFSLVGTSSTATLISPFTTGQLAISGNTVVWFENGATTQTLKYCTLPTCVPASASFAAKVSLFTFALANGRIYFNYGVTDSCNVSNVALASCSLSTLAAGTCTPQIHATDFRLLGAKSMAVGSTYAFVTSQSGATYRVTL